MKQHPTLTLLFTLLLLTAVADGRAQTGRQNHAPSAPPLRQPDGAANGQPFVSEDRRPSVAPRGQGPVAQSRLEGGTYFNDFFGISFSPPRGWVAQDMAAKQAIVDSGKKIFEGDNANPRERASVEASLQRTYFLLSVSKYDLKTPPPGEFNAQLSFIAERVPTAVIKTGGDYITQMMRVAQKSAAKLELTGPIRTEKLGGVSFAVADAKLSVGTAVVVQKYRATVRNGYALLFAFSYVDEPDAQAFEDVINSIKFK